MMFVLQRYKKINCDASLHYHLLKTSRNSPQEPGIKQMISDSGIKEIQVMACSSSIEELKCKLMLLYKEHTSIALNEGYYDGNGAWITRDMIDLVNEHEQTNLEMKDFSEDETREIYGRWMGAVLAGLDLRDIESEEKEESFTGVIHNYIVREFGDRFHYIISEISTLLNNLEN